jgi:RHS repeat-associated protein
MNGQPRKPQRIATQRLELPSGGGSIAGMGEKLETTDFTGAAELTIPLPVARARDAQPPLELVYSSYDGNGVFGLGVSLQLGSVKRLTSYGIPTYDKRDVFTFGDALVPVKQSTQRVGSAPYEVVEYLSRVEHQRSRIEQWIADDESSFWRITTPDNRTTIYGRDDATRISDTADPRRVFEWLPAYEYDAHGNLTLYTYRREDMLGVADEMYERGRAHSANLYLSRVSYGNTKAFDPQTWLSPISVVDFCFETVFDYGEYSIDPSNDDPYTPTGTWLPRLDPFSDYRAGFERRTHRLCRSVLLFHRFKELGSLPVLTRAVRFQYSESAVASMLSAVQTIGYRHVAKRPSGKRYLTKAMPPLTLEYTAFTPQTYTQSELRGVRGESAPAFASASHYALADMTGGGIPSIVYADGVGVRYWDPVITPDGEQQYANRAPSAFPIDRAIAPAQCALVDLEGNGEMALAVFDRYGNGFYQLRSQGDWSPFQPFTSTANISPAQWELADLDQDGRSDLLQIDRLSVSYFPGEGYDGYSELRQAPRTNDVPQSTQAGGLELIAFANLCGTSGEQRVRIRDGCVECWPSLGGGRFGDCVQLGNAPHFGASFDPHRIRLADVDGSGTTDLIYVHSDRVDVYVNRSGNSFAPEPISIPLPSALMSPEQVSTADVYGKGTHAIVFTEHLPALRHRCFDLAPSGKPYLLTATDNNMGSSTTIRYASSSRFFLEDARDGWPWITALPFPVQVVTEIVRRDAISQTSDAVSYRYHHGYYDASERAFRGFGMVESFDVERDVLEAIYKTPRLLASPAYVSPTHTKNWYNLGNWELNAQVRAAYEQEFFQGDSEQAPVPPSRFAWIDASPSPEILREAYAALAGRLIRSEIYGVDPSAAGADVPFAVTTQSYEVRQLSDQAPGGYAAFAVHESQQFNSTYDRVANDPRVTHHLNLRFDDDGNLLRSAGIAYPRRQKDAPNSCPEQYVPHVTCEENAFFQTQETQTDFLLGLLRDEMRYEVTSLTAAPDVDGRYYSFDEAARQIELALDANASHGAARLLAAHRYGYLSDANGVPLPQALLQQTQTAAFADATAQKVWGNLPLPQPLGSFLTDAGGYALSDGIWWRPSDLQSYHGADLFYLPMATKDAFAEAGRTRSGAVVSYEYDLYALLLTKVTTTPTSPDVITTCATGGAIDYQIPALRQCTDPNGTISEVLYDPLGIIFATTHYGSELDENGTSKRVGFDPFDFDSDEWPQPPSPSDLVSTPTTYLRGAASFVYYDMHAWQDGGTPVFAMTARSSVYPPNAASPVAISVIYTDGEGERVQELHNAPADGKQMQWIVADTVRYNVKRLPVEQYEPFFASTYVYVAPSALPLTVARRTFSYDALDRIVRTTRPAGELAQGVFSTTQFSPWEDIICDENDTVMDSPYYQYYVVEKHPLPQYDLEALTKAAAFANTPTHRIYDNLRNVIATVQTLSSDASVPPIETRSAYDVDGHMLWSADSRLYAQGLHNVDSIYGLDGRVLAVTTADAGLAATIDDVAGNALFTCDQRGIAVSYSYDSLHRATLTCAAGKIQQRAIYGDSLDSSGKTVFDDNTGRNIVGRIAVAYDESGRSQVTAYSILGNPASTERSLASAYAGEADWSAPVCPTWAQLFAALVPRLESETFRSAARYDAAGNVLQEVDVCGNVHRYVYDVCARLLSASVIEPSQPEVTFLDGIVYDASSQRLQMTACGPGGALLQTFYQYDPATNRLRSVRATRVKDSTVLQELRYYADPVGNCTRVENIAATSKSRTRYYRQQVVTPGNTYTYDAAYRLIQASGRGKLGLTAADARDGGYGPFLGSGVNDEQAVENYTFTYHYDQGDNLSMLRYSASKPWTQWVNVDPRSNRAVASDTAPPQPFPSDAFDPSGNLLKLNGSAALRWDYRGCLASTTLVARSSGPSDAEYYQYAASRERMRKIMQRLVGAQTELTQTLYFGNVEIYRRSRGEQVLEEYHRIRVRFGGESVSELLRWKVGSPPPGVDSKQTRYSLNDALGSSTMQLDESANVTAYEEYAPYGATTYVIGASLAEVSLREYRFAAKERDQSTGLSYMGARYYLPWLGRWTSADPAGVADGLNLYRYSRNNPATLLDPSGLFPHSFGAKMAGKNKGGKGVGKPKKAPKAGLDFPQGIASRTRGMKFDYRRFFSGSTGRINARRAFRTVLRYPKDPRIIVAAIVDAELLRLHGLLKRAPFPAAITPQLAAKVKNQWTIKYNKEGGLAAAKVSRNHHLADSAIKAITVNVMHTVIGAGKITATQTKALKRWMSALAGKNEAPAIFKSFTEAIGHWKVKSLQFVAGILQSVHNRLSPTKQNVDLGHDKLNTMMDNTFDGLTPATQEIYDATRGLETAGLAHKDLIDATLTPPTVIATGELLNSFTAKFLVDLGLT